MARGTTLNGGGAGWVQEKGKGDLGRVCLPSRESEGAEGLNRLTQRWNDVGSRIRLRLGRGAKQKTSQEGVRARIFQGKIEKIGK